MERHKLNSMDLRILYELQENGRITNVDLSRRAKITAPPCLRRMRALEKAGYIKGYHADLDGKALGFEVTGFAFVGLVLQADADLKRFGEQARVWPQVRECYMLSARSISSQMRRKEIVVVPVLHYGDADRPPETSRASRRRSPSARANTARRPDRNSNNTGDCG